MHCAHTKAQCATFCLPLELYWLADVHITVSIVPHWMLSYSNPGFCASRRQTVDLENKIALQTRDRAQIIQVNWWSDLSIDQCMRRICWALVHFTTEVSLWSVWCAETAGFGATRYYSVDPYHTIWCKQRLYRCTRCSTATKERCSSSCICGTRRC